LVPYTLTAFYKQTKKEGLYILQKTTLLAFAQVERIWGYYPGQTHLNQKKKAVKINLGKTTYQVS
jgi:hypothetical protein